MSIFNLLISLVMLNVTAVDRSKYKQDADTQCKATALITVNSVISSENDVISLFNFLARKLDNGKFLNRKYSYDVKYINGFWTVYGEDVTGKPDNEKLGVGGLYLSVEACSGIVVEFRYTR